MKILTSTLAKIALRVTWDPAPTVGLRYEIKKEYPDLSAQQVFNLCGRILESGLIKQIWKEKPVKGDVNKHYVGKYILADGITKEIL